MWWNFIGRSHEEVVRAREAWHSGSDRFGSVQGYDGERLPAPVLPNATLTPRQNPARTTPGRDPMSSSETPVVGHAADKHRYEITVDGRLAGFSEYRDRDGQRVFFHTVIDEAFGGRGLGTVLVRQALTDVREAGKRVVPACPFVAKFLERHDEFAAITDPVTADVRHWLKATLG